MAGIRELSERILLITGYVLSFVFEYGTFIGKEPGRNTISSKDLKSNMIISIESLLFIEESTDDLASGIINGEVKMCDPITKPEMRRSVHLDEFAVRS